MKKIWNFLKNFVIIAYILLIIFITICLLSYNKYKVTVFGKNTFLPIIDEDLEPDYKYGDLLIINKNNLSSVREGDVVFFYRTVAGITTVNYATVVKYERVSDTETTFTVEGGFVFSSSYFIGKADTATVIPKVGKVIGVLESKWGFLFLGVFPSLIAFLYTVHSIIMEMQEDDEDIDEKPKKKKKNSKTKKKKENEKNKVEEKEEVVTEETKEKNEDNENINWAEKNDTTKNDEENIDIAKENEESTKKEDEKNSSKENDANDSDSSINNIEEKNETSTQKTITEEEKKALIQAKLNSMTEEEKKALIQAKLNSMTDEQKRALIEAKKKKMQTDNK